MRTLFYLTLVLCVLLHFDGYSNPKNTTSLTPNSYYKISSDFDKKSISEHLLIYADSSGELSINNMPNMAFKSVRSLELTAGITYWGRIGLDNLSNEVRTVLLDLGNHEQIQIYTFEGEEWTTQSCGEIVPANAKSVLSGRCNCMAVLNLSPNDQSTIFIKFNAKDLFNKKSLNLSLYDLKTWYKERVQFLAFQASFHGALFILFIISLLFFLSNKDKVFLFYSLFLLSSSIFFLWYHGIIQDYILPLFPKLSSYFWTTVILIQLFNLMFLRSLTNLKSYSKKYDRWIIYTIALNFIFFGLVFLLSIITGNSPVLKIASDYFLLSQIIFTCFIFLRLEYSDDRVSKFFIGSAIFITLFFVVGLLLHLFYLPLFSAFIAQIGILVSAVLYAISMGFRYYETQLYTSRDHEKVMHQLEQHKQLQEDMRAQLKNEVEDKLCELEYRNHRMSDLMINLEKANTDLGQINYLASHDLKTPLRGISSITEFLCQDYGDKLDEEGQNNLSLLKDRVIRMNKMLDGLLFYNGVGKSFHASDIQVKELLGQTIDELRIDRKISVLSKIHDAVEIFDPKWLKIIFKELIINSVQCMDKEWGHIEIGVKSINGLNIYSVRDNGRGIAPRNTKKIFNLFVTTDRKIEDRTGIGLSVVKKLVELCEGKIWVESKPGIGTVFYFFLFEMPHAPLPKSIQDKHFAAN